tara:strand:- start:226 stop:423 length:198 start_codon:yes stop_codon:yes gene_type:complete
MSIQKELEKLELEINQLKSNGLNIEEQIDLYKTAIDRINTAKKTITALKESITIIEKNNDNNPNK